MKKLLFLFLSIAAGITGWIVIFGNPVSKVSPADLLPDDCYVYFEQKNGSEVWQNFVESSFGKAVVNLDYKRICEVLEIPEKDKQNFLQQIANLKSLKDDKLVQDIFGKRVVFAFVPGKKKVNIEQPLEVIKDRFVVVTRPKYSANLVETLAEQFYDKSEISSLNYGKFSIQQIVQDGLVLSAVTIDGYFIFSYQLEQIKRCIDSYEKKIPSLAESSEFVRHGLNDLSLESFGFMAIDKVVQAGIRLAENLEGGELKEIEREFSEIRGFLSGSYIGSNNNHLIKEKARIYFDREKLSELNKRKIERQPEKNKTVHWLVEDTLGYYWANTLNLQSIWEFYAKESDLLPQMIMLEEAFSAFTDDNLKEFLGLFTGEIALFLDKSEDGQLIPVPGFAVFMKVSDSIRVKQGCNKIAANYGLPLQEKEYKDVHYQCSGPFLQDGLQPLFGSVDDYFFLASGPKVIQHYLDRVTEKTTSSSITGSFPDSETGLLEKNNVVTMVKVDEMILEAKKIITWGRNLLGLQGQELEKVDEIVNLLVFPLLDGACMYKESVSRTYFTEDSIIFESHTNIE